MTKPFLAVENLVVDYHVPGGTFRAVDDVSFSVNKGKTIAYANPVTSVQTAGMWHGKAQRFELPRSEVNKKGGCAILLQSVGKDGGPGPILGAALIGKPPSK